MTDMKTCLELTRKQLDEILLGDDGATLPLLQERYLCIQQSADVLLKKYKGMLFKFILYNLLYYCVDLIPICLNIIFIY